MVAKLGLLNEHLVDSCRHLMLEVGHCEECDVPASREPSRTQDYARTQGVWLAANESRAVDVRRVTSDREFEMAQADRRFAQAEIEEGLLRRSLITAIRR